MAAPALHLAWFNPVQVHWGDGGLAAWQADRPTVVLADRAAVSAATEAALLKSLGPHACAWGWFPGGLSTVALAQCLCESLWPAMQDPHTQILAVGGGSTLDLAKVLRFRMESPSSAPDYWRNNQVPAGTVRHALTLVPTTAGTGSEVSPSATLWDTSASPAQKRSWAPPQGFAEVALIDPQLTLSCPVRQSRDSGLDTLAHALEALWNRQASPVSDALALQAARCVLDALPRVLASPQDIAARAAMAQASLLAGLAMSRTQTALAHAMSYALTLEENIPHGEACALWLPMVWDLARQHSPDHAARLAQVFGGRPEDGAEQLAQWLRRLGVEPRDARDSASGQARLAAEMRSSRGRNFIGSPT